MPAENSPPRPLTVVWFKRDLRLHDHAPLSQAAQAGTVLPLYVIEPEYWALPDVSYRQWRFWAGAIADLQQQIATLGGQLCLRSGAVVDVLSQLRADYGPFDLVAHQETGNAWTFARDNAVRDWCHRNGADFTEHQQHGIWRGAALDRNRWAKRWDAMMAAPLTPIPSDIDWARVTSDALPDAAALGLTDDGIVAMQSPGLAAARATLDSFLHDRGAPYQKAMSSPVSGETACSRLSPHLMAGSISMREVYQATLARQSAVAALPKADRGTWPSAMKSFVGRLHWHCHFMQKLEAEPEIEWLPMARIYEGLRPTPTDSSLLSAFEEGRTGYPFVDACMRYLRATGWINFRMRAMLMSFASYNLWLPWQQSGTVLARLFTDYEPGIHWPQSQMQSGETGINAVRIYSPVKQGYDQDPTGVFTRQWVPELAHLTGKALQDPWTLDALPKGYPARIVDHQQTAREAKQRIYGLRRTAEARSQSAAIFEKHGSRKPRDLRTRRKVAHTDD
ncbi:FAD-binding domain-containing protein [Roseobacter sp. CCS2]|uniref:FAD-binding domain-containing protein n=1 Tax=Roseobacter sp. CCS2 TaxID=391593 RepID=UPI0000F3C427|nr:FAD-binding domain-containing protein [Roseobacter sp. CCS2]EBA11566.1 putative deoxyribodipyrimidine photolyase [Roseobacter sp. CCS2]